MINEIVGLQKIYQTKRSSQSSTLEEEQLWALSTLYGKGAVLLVLKSLKNVSIPTISKALMQIGGFAESVPPSLKGLVYTTTEAEKKYDAAQIEVANRFGELVKLLSDNSQAAFIAVNKHGVTFHQLWEDSSNHQLTDKDLNALNKGLMEFGESLVERAITLLSGNNVNSENKRVAVFQKWLTAASDRNISELEQITVDAGIAGTAITWGLPLACPFIVTAYFSEKAQRDLEENDILLLSKLVNSSSDGDVVFSISSIPSAEFSLDRFTREHYERFGSAIDLTQYYIERNQLIYKCDDCQAYLVELDSVDKFSSDFSICPICSSKSEVHSLHQEIAGLDDGLMKRFQEEEPMVYHEDNYFLHFKSTERSSQYCGNCGHFFITNKTYTRLG